MKTLLSTILAASVSATALAQSTMGDVVALDEWNYDDLYNGGWSVEEFIDEMDALDSTGEDIGDIEDVIIGAQGNVLAVVVEAGGFLDIGDTHISVPWDQVKLQGTNVILPVTEENIEEYDYYNYSGLPGGKLSNQVIFGVDDAPAGTRAWRATEMIGDYARLEGGSTNYGYVNDLIVKDGKVTATVVDPDTGYGPGYYAYPYYGYGYGAWSPGAGYYDMPYSADEIGSVEPFEYDRVGS